MKQKLVFYKIHNLININREIIFITRNGDAVERIFFETLILGAYIHQKVIDCWLILLNDEESRKQKGSPLRFHFLTGIIVSNIYIMYIC